MPSIACRSRIRAASEHCGLCLDVRHRLVAGNPSDAVHYLGKTRVPDDVDVLVASNVVITLSGVLDGRTVSAEEVYASALCQHLVDYFRMNAVELGLSIVSGLQMNEENELLQMVLTPSRRIPINPETAPVCLLLVAIDLCYSWQTLDCVQAKFDRANHPFSARLSLPYKTLLDNVVGRFMTWQLVRRYPLIFGPWCQQLDVESSYFPGVFNSIFRVIERSPNAAFQARCRRLIRTLRSQRLLVLSDASTSLSTYLASVEDLGFLSSDTLREDITDEEALCFALERVFRSGLSRLQFKGLVIATNADRADDEDLSQEHAVLSPEEPTARPREDLSWDDASKDALRPGRPLSPSIHAWLLSMPSEGETGFNVDKALDSDPSRWSEDGLVGVNWSDDELLAVERPQHLKKPEVRSSRCAHSNLNSPDSFHDMECITPPPVLDFEDGAASSDSLLYPSRTGAVGLKEIASESALCQDLAYDRVTLEEDPTNQHSQDAAGRMTGLGDRSHAACPLVYVRSRPISGLPWNQKETDYLGKQETTLYQLQLREHSTAPGDLFEMDDSKLYAEAYTAEVLDPFSHDPLDGDDDMDLAMLSDSDFEISVPRETIFEDHRDLDKDGGVAVALVDKPDFPEARNSSDSPTLAITCPQQSDWHRQLRDFREELQDTDEEFWCGEAVGDSAQIACFEEDILAVMDFAHDAP
ncbi:hypothetical protein LshimejAT787_0503980 [Lyophyllum shimeji]|uniref:Uncharacterized protein n=1 Tax=Lyophyllum shimeji TaxID=47721 RepID=A0A9P3PMB2_LYOSH|nr:hypothetical protein LshimejAT787_0503980 [Lyophyllum shimeji]